MSDLAAPPDEALVVRGARRHALRRGLAERPAAPGAVLAAILYVLILPLIALQKGIATGAYDQELYHLPTIERFSDELPFVDLNAVNTATGPGYHYLLAFLHRFVSDDRVVLELFSSLISLAFLLVMLRLASRFVDGWVAFALVLPLLFSPFTVESAAWLMTDHLAVLFVVLSLGWSLEVADGRVREHRAGLASAAAVVVRQIHLWTLGPLAVAAWLADRDKGGRRHLVRVLLWSVPAVTTIVALVVIWGGLTPPGFQEINASRRSPSVFPFTLALSAIVCAFYLPAAGIWPARLDRRYAAAAVIGLLSAVVIPTSEDYDAGRGGGGLWKLVEHTPTVADRSIVMALLAAAGAAALLHLGLEAARRRRNVAIVMLVALLSFACAQSATNYVYQRYIEPIVLIVVITLSAVALGRESMSAAKLRRLVIAIALLVALQGAATASEVYRDTINGPEFPYPPGGVG